MGDSQQEPDPGHGEPVEGVWHPPNQNAAIMAEAAPAVEATSQNGAGFVDGGHLGQGYVTVAGQFGTSGYQELRSSFSGAYPNQQDLFQAAHSTFEAMTPPHQNTFAQHDHNDSEAIPAYSGITASNAAHIIAASTVDSSTLQQGYLVLDQDNQVVAVQRVVSPADCTVSQSTLSVGPDVGDGQPNATLLTMPAMSSGSAQYVMQVTMSAFSSHGEVSTSSRDQEPLVSSLGATFQPGMLAGVRKVEMESTTGECDTTQADLDCPSHDAANSYLQGVNLAADSVGMDSQGLHSTMMAGPRPVVATVTSADLHDHAAIHSSQLSSLHNVTLAPVVSSDRAEPSTSSLGRVVDDHAISHALEEAMVSGSGVAENSMGDLHRQPFSLMVATTAVPSQCEDEQPSTSGTSMHHNPSQILCKQEPCIQPLQLQTRKSSRLAQYQRQEEMDNRMVRQQYEPRQYNVQELWCEECQMAYDQQCSLHRLTAVVDRVVLSRAWASLPAMLHIFRLGSANVGDGNSVEMGVFAKKPISKQTQFGPFTADLVDSAEQVSNKNFLLMLEKADGTQGYFDTQDENKCNWMMFVRAAETYAEQNLVAYQHGQDIFFSVIKNIEPRQELKVWYAAHYAERLGQKAHELTDSDWALMDEQASRFQCSACSRRFRTSMALQRHLLEHERDEAGMEEEKGEEEEEGEEEDGRRGRRKAGTKNYLLKNKARQNGDAASGYQWKKKSTSIYINKTLRKYQKRGGSDRVRQTIKSMYRRRGRGAGGQQEWVCTHCDLTFDNNNLLNLHTLTHAAEDVDLEEKIRKLASESATAAASAAATGVASKPMENGGGDVSIGDGILGPQFGEEVGLADTSGNLVGLETCLLCPVCRVQFDDKRALIEHAAEHAKAPRPDRPFKCQLCWKGFTSKEKLQKHLLCHGEEASKPLSCTHCNKRFMNNSALACHLKTHSEKKYYQCPMCSEGFDHISCLKQHLPRHADENGQFTCKICKKKFEDYHGIRKHMRNFHSENKHICNNCGRMFPRPDKLKLHMLRHTSHREFMCETCGRQFKRKDKLKEHIKRMHCADRETRAPSRPHKGNTKKFIPRVSPSDYQRFIYKCNTCMLGFKRRGMLVNHLNKKHPNIKIENVHELNLPILKPQKDYFCQHCDKVYKSSSKRKSHILKNHPGAALPASGRKKMCGDLEEAAGNPTFSQTIGSITTLPHGCIFCHKQYASKAKLMQHQRKVHPDLVPAAQERRSKVEVKNDYVIDITVADDNNPVVTGDRYEDVVVATPNAMGDGLQQADLLTQAMTELISSHDFRQGNNITVHTPEAIPIGRIVTAGGPTLLQVQPNGTLQPATIELSQLTQALSAHPQFAGHSTQIPAGTTLITTPSAPQQQQVLSAQPVNISMVTNNGGSAIPVSIQGNQAFVPRTWSSTIQTLQR